MSSLARRLNAMFGRRNSFWARAGLVVALVLPGPTVTAATHTFSTSDTEILPDTDNQGWYTDRGQHNEQNDNYLVGDNGGDLFRNFFLFDLSSLNLSGQVVTSATLELRRYSANSIVPDFIFQYGLFDVSLGTTPPATLMADHPLVDPGNTNAEGIEIYGDLGSGTAYGVVAVDSDLGSSDDLLTFTLNAAAIADLSVAAGGFFGIGGAITNLPGDVADIHGGSGGETMAPPPFVRDPGIQRLTIEVVPEPGTLTLIAGGISLLSIWRRWGTPESRLKRES